MQICELIELLRRFPQTARVEPHEGQIVIVTDHQIRYDVDAPDSDLPWLRKAGESGHS